MSTVDPDPIERPGLPPPSRREPDFSLRALLPWLIPAIALGIFALALMALNKH